MKMDIKSIADLERTITDYMGEQANVTMANGKTVSGKVHQHNKTHVGILESCGAIVLCRKDSVRGIEV